MYTAHTSDLFFSPGDSGYAMFALSSRDKKKQKKKTNRSTETSILYCCYNGTIKRKQLDIKNIHALCSCVLLVVLLFSVVIVVWVLPTVTVLPHLISFLFFLTRLAKQNKQAEEDCSFHTINGSVCLVQ